MLELEDVISTANVFQGFQHHLTKNLVKLYEVGKVVDNENNKVATV